MTILLIFYVQQKLKGGYTVDSWFLKNHWFKLSFCSLEPKLNHLQPLRHWTFKKVWKFIWVHWHSQVTWEPATYSTSGRSRPSDKGAPGLKKKIFWLFFRPHFRLKMGWGGGGGGEQAPEPFPWIRHCQLSLSHKTFFCFQGPNYYSQEKKRQKSENRFTHNVSALVVTNTLWPASFF